MIRTFNYTGRKKIERQHVRISLRPNRKPLEFDAEMELGSYGFPPDADVVVEAYYKTAAAHMRFSFGRVADLAPPGDRRLTEIDGEIVFFRVIVVDRSQGAPRIVGVAENLQPGEDQLSSGSRFNLLPVNFIDLGDEVWNLTLDPRPILEINQAIAGIRDLAHHPLFFGCVYPEVVRRVLNAIAADGIDDDVQTQWKAMWLRYAKALADAPDTVDPDEIRDWIEEVVDRFSSSHRVREQFAGALAQVTS